MKINFIGNYTRGKHVSVDGAFYENKYTHNICFVKNQKRGNNMSVACVSYKTKYTQNMLNANIIYSPNPQYRDSP